MALKLFARKKPGSPAADPKSGSNRRSANVSQPSTEFVSAPVKLMDGDPLRRLIQQGRCSIVLRQQKEWQSHPNARQLIAETVATLEQTMALVPAGSVTLYQTLSAQPGQAEVESNVKPYLLSVLTVTNDQFQRFVDADGYDALEYWPEEIWPHLIELKDLSGHPGPRFWKDGRHHAAYAQHPVVGISWFEAQAFSLWIGQRLPTEEEWQMAASWHIRSSTDMMRRFPWGDAMDNTRCNIWSSHHGSTVEVSAFPRGAAPNQVRQLVGNVWEWTDSEFLMKDDVGRTIIGEMPMEVVRGGAFDTYFETQATAAFRTGQLALARNQNTGFRCAMDLGEATWLSGE